MSYSYRRYHVYKAIVFPVPDDPTIFEDEKIVPHQVRYSGERLGLLWAQRQKALVALRSPTYTVHVQEKFASQLTGEYEAVFDDRQGSICRMLIQRHKALQPHRPFPISKNENIRVYSSWTPRTQPSTSWTNRTAPSTDWTPRTSPY